jgi:hypothetical protein
MRGVGLSAPKTIRHRVGRINVQIATRPSVANMVSINWGLLSRTLFT